MESHTTPINSHLHTGSKNVQQVCMIWLHFSMSVILDLIIANERWYTHQLCSTFVQISYKYIKTIPGFLLDQSFTSASILLRSYAVLLYQKLYIIFRLYKICVLLLLDTLYRNKIVSFMESEVRQSSISNQKLFLFITFHTKPIRHKLTSLLMQHVMPYYNRLYDVRDAN